MIHDQSGAGRSLLLYDLLMVAVVALAPSVAPWPARVDASPVHAAAAGTGGGTWTTYHHDNAHTGYDPLAPAAVPGAIAATPGWTQPTLDGEIYAEPLIFNGAVYVATLNNTVYALSQSDGSVLWSNHLGTPQATRWSCGNVAPIGNLGTPVIDTAANRIYAVAEIAGPTPGSTPVYHLYCIDLATHVQVLDTPIAPTGFDWKIQQERGALALANGYVYVPFGGRAGDCFDGSTPYYGWVVGVPTDGVSSSNVFQPPSGAESVWAPGGVVIDDTSHNVFFATGNAIPCAGSSLSDAVVRVSPTLTSPAFFEPNDWQSNWCSPDSDLGPASPLLISPNLMFTAGKHGGGFLLDPTKLGGVNGQLYPAKTPYVQANVCFGNTSAATFGSFAYLAPFIYLQCEGHGLVALHVNTSTPSFSPCNAACASPDWSAGSGITFGPPIVAGGAVWVASSSGLYAYNATTGAQIFHSASFGVNRFVTPAEAGGQVFVPSHTVVYSFTIAPPAAYTAVNPVRLLDTRSSGGAVGAGQSRSLTVAGLTPGAPANQNHRHSIGKRPAECGQQARRRRQHRSPGDGRRRCARERSFFGDPQHHRHQHHRAELPHCLALWKRAAERLQPQLGGRADCAQSRHRANRRRRQGQCLQPVRCGRRDTGRVGLFHRCDGDRETLHAPSCPSDCRHTAPRHAWPGRHVHPPGRRCFPRSGHCDRGRHP